jgi:hypothetical protein
MFNSVFSRIGNPRAWRRATIELCEVPMEPGSGQDDTLRLLTVAGGIALVLSRCPGAIAKRHYPATTELYKFIRTGLRRSGRVLPNAELLLDSFHEVSGKLDPVSRQAMRECLEAQRDREQRARPRPARAAPAAAPREDARVAMTPSSFEILEDQ